MRTIGASMLLASLLSFGLAGSASGRDVSKVARVECPMTTVYELCWREKIGGDPTLKHMGDRCHKANVDLVYMKYAKSHQVAECHYESPHSRSVRQVYRYKIKRQVMGVKAKNRNYVELYVR